MYDHVDGPTNGDWSWTVFNMDGGACLETFSEEAYAEGSNSLTESGRESSKHLKIAVCTSEAETDPPSMNVKYRVPLVSVCSWYLRLEHSDHHVLSI